MSFIILSIAASFSARNGASADAVCAGACWAEAGTRDMPIDRTAAATVRPIGRHVLESAMDQLLLTRELGVEAAVLSAIPPPIRHCMSAVLPKQSPTNPQLCSP